jgi:hypothetical protein
MLLRHTDDTVYGRLIAEDGGEMGLPSFDTGTKSWTPSRVGYVARGSSGRQGTAVADWFYNTFA